jgi:ribosome maturation factor RimP
MRTVPERLLNLLRDEIDLLGYELVGVELTGDGKSSSLLRIYIDHEDGINLDDCVQVSHQVSGVLDVEDPIRESYRLEVSSPGLDRPLFELKDFQRFCGHKAKIKTRLKLQERRRFTGILKGVEERQVLIEEDGTLYRIPIDEVDTARLVPEF